MSDIKQHFATLPIDKIGNEIMARVEDNYRLHYQTGWNSLQAQLHQQYFAGFYTLGDIQQKGELGEITEVSVNNFQSNVQRVHTDLIVNAPISRTRPKTSNQKDINSAEYGNDVLREIYDSGYRKNKALRAFHAVLYGIGWQYGFWNKFLNGGKGGYDSYVPLPISVCYDVYGCTDPGKSDWYAIRHEGNKYDLAATVEGANAAETAKLRERIISYDYSKQKDFFWEYWWFSNLFKDQQGARDKIVWWTFIKPPSPAVPKGRICHLADAELVWGYKEYERSTLTCVYPYLIDGLPYAGSNSFSALVVQRMRDALDSGVMTRMNAFMLPTIAMENVSGSVPLEETTSGLRILKYLPQGQLPTVLEFLQIPQDLNTKIQTLDAVGAMILNVPEIMRGELPEGHKLSGKALEILSVNAAQQNSGLKQGISEATVKEDEAALFTFQKCATEPQKVKLTGKFRAKIVKDIKGSELDGIDGVDLEVIDPYVNSPEGRRKIIEEMKELGFIKTPEQLFKAYNTGKVESITDPIEAAIARIKEDQELLLGGVKPEYCVLFKHFSASQMAMEIMSSDIVMGNKPLYELAREYYEAHKAGWLAMSIEDRIIFQEPDPPPPPMPVLPPGAPVPAGAPPVPAGAAAPVSVAPGQGLQRPIRTLSQPQPQGQ